MSDKDLIEQVRNLARAHADCGPEAPCLLNDHLINLLNEHSAPATCQCPSCFCANGLTIVDTSACRQCRLGAHGRTIDGAR